MPSANTRDFVNAIIDRQFSSRKLWTETITFITNVNYVFSRKQTKTSTAQQAKQKELRIFTLNKKLNSVLKSRYSSTIH